jgi:ABC-2 type transport system ATP-binding protein
MTGAAAPAGPAAPRPAGTTPAWGAWGVTVRTGTTLALADVTLAVPAGQVTAVVGGDGAGKTTLLRCLAGALAPSAGEVRSPGPRRTGYLPGSSGTYPDLTVAENLAFRAAAYRMTAAAARSRADDLIARAGLTAARDRPAGQLSGGMRQKLGVICALLHEPALLILDEPTTGVDPVSRAGLGQLIAGAAAAGAAVVLSTTYLAEAQRAAAVLVLDGGQPLAAGSPEEIVAARPGRVVAWPGPPPADARPRSWRRDGQWRTWIPARAATPAGTAPPDTAPPDTDTPDTDPPGAAPAQPVEPDLQDAVTVATLARELRAGPPPPASTPAAGHEPGHEPGRAMAAPPGPLAECVAVTRRFGPAVAVREVSLQVRPGEIVGLLGANGAGKTTLIRMLLGVLPATSGTIALFGAAPSRDARRQLGYVPQGLGLYDDLTAAENLSFSAAVFRAPRAPRARATPRDPAAALPADFRSRAAAGVGALPLGLQRRTAFAQALAHHPSLLILDEPTSGVDPLGRARLWETIRAAAEAGAGALVTTHDLEEASECDRLVIMADGTVAAAGTPPEVIGAATVTVVDAPDWRTAFARLEARGLAVTLAGRSLRVATAGPDQVRQALAAGPGPAARVGTAPATLEERFFQLVAAAAAGKDG